MSEDHKAPAGECIFCAEELSEENYAEFKALGSSMGWRPSPYCSNCIKPYFIDKQWETYIKLIAEADCAAALRRVLNKPPPQYVTDKGFALDDAPDGVVEQFWFSDGNQLISSKLKGALEGPEREKFWQEKKEGLAALEAAEAESGEMALLAKATKQ